MPPLRRCKPYHRVGRPDLAISGYIFVWIAGRSGAQPAQMSVFCPATCRFAGFCRQTCRARSGRDGIGRRPFRHVMPHLGVDCCAYRRDSLGSFVAGPNRRHPGGGLPLWALPPAFSPDSIPVVCIRKVEAGICSDADVPGCRHIQGASSADAASGSLGFHANGDLIDRRSHHRATRGASMAPSKARSATAIVYQVATNNGESSVQWAA